jgi:hypothetical protein
MRIEYIFIRFLQFMSYRNFEQKTIFWFSKEEVSLKVKKKPFEMIFFFFFTGSIICHISNM